MLKVGIIGTGFGGTVHLPAWRSLPDVAVVAVADAGSGAASKLDGDHAAYSDWKALMARGDIDLIDVVTPPAVQREIVLAALTRDRHVLCEKPFGAGFDDAVIMSGAQNPNCITGVCYQFRFEPAFQKLRALLQSGAIGSMLRIDVRWMTGGRSDPTRPWGFQHDVEAGGGVGNAFLSHVVDYLLWSTQARLSVDGGTRTVMIGSRPDDAGIPRKVTAEDSADFLGRLDDAVPVNVAISNCVPGGEGHRVDMYGKRGRLSLSFFPPFRSTDVELVLHHEDKLEPQLCESGSGVGDSRFPAVRSLFEAVQARIDGATSSDVPTFDDGLTVQRVLRDWRAAACC